MSEQLPKPKPATIRRILRAIAALLGGKVGRAIEKAVQSEEGGDT